MHSINPLLCANILQPEQGCNTLLYPAAFHKNNPQQRQCYILPPPICSTA